MQGSESGPLHRGRLTSAQGSDLKLNPLPGISPPRKRADREGEPLPRLEKGPERAWAPQEAPEPSLGVRGEAGWERPRGRGASRVPPPQAQGSGLDSSLRFLPPSLPADRAGPVSERAGTWNRNSEEYAPRDPHPGGASASSELRRSHPHPGPVFPERGAEVEITEPWQLAAGSGQQAAGEGLGPARGPHSLEHLLGFRSPAGPRNSVGTQTRPGFFRTVWPWPNHSSFLSLSCLICNKGPLISPSPWVVRSLKT